MGQAESLYLYPVKSQAPVPDLEISLYMYCSLFQEMGRVEILYLYSVKSQAPCLYLTWGSGCTCTQLFSVSGDGPI
jgi:hypothetical protein